MSSANKFKYIVCATSQNTMHHKKYEWDYPPNPELIYLTAILVNLHTGKIEDEFSKYIKPADDYVSWYCTEMTGIKQAEVDKGEELEIVLEQFQTWMDKLKTTKGVRLSKNCNFLYWSNKEFEKQLKGECLRKKLKVPPAFSAPKVLIRKDFLIHTQKPLSSKIDTEDAMKHLSLRYSGREDAKAMVRNSAKIAVRLSKLGCALNVVQAALKSD